MGRNQAPRAQAFINTQPGRVGHAQAFGTQQQNGSGRVGLKLKSSRQNGCIVHKVNAGEAAERAGILTNDIITYVNNRPTRNLAEFREVCNNACGPLSVQVRRSGGRKLLLTVIR